MNHLIMFGSVDDPVENTNGEAPISLMDSVAGMEDLGVGERINLFLKEFGTRMDKRLAGMGKSVHCVDLESVRKAIQKKEILFVKNVGVEILTPEGYAPGFGNMAMHNQAVIAGIYIISNFRTETSRLYDWLKQIIVKGRIDRSFEFSISDFDRTLQGAEQYLRLLKDNARKVTYPLGKVYLNFDEYFAVGNAFNNAVQTFSAREIELTTRELSNVYDMGQLLVKKVKANDITLNQQGLTDIDYTVNRFMNMANVAGAMAVLLNDMSAVLTAQGETIKNLS